MRVVRTQSIYQTETRHDNCELVTSADTAVLQNFVGKVYFKRKHDQVFNGTGCNSCTFNVTLAAHMRLDKADRCAANHYADQ